MKTCDYNGFKSEKYNNNKKDKTTHKQKSAQEIRHDSDALKRWRSDTYDFTCDL